MSGVGSEKFSKLKDDIFCTPVEIDDKNNEFVPKLYETRGWQDIKIDEPITQGLLDSNKTFMLVAGPKNIYTWLGRFTTKIQRRTVNEVAGLFIKDNKMPSNTNIELVYEGLEATSFKQFFPSWKDFIDTKSGKSDHPSEEVLMRGWLFEVCAPPAPPMNPNQGRAKAISIDSKRCDLINKVGKS